MRIAIIIVHTLSEKHVSHSAVQVINDWLTAVNHQTISKLHRLGTLTTQLARHDYFAALSATLHDEFENTIAGSAPYI